MSEKEKETVMEESKKSITKRCGELSKMARDLLVVVVEDNNPLVAQYFLVAWVAAEHAHRHFGISPGEDGG